MQQTKIKDIEEGKAKRRKNNRTQMSETQKSINT